jgi:hypothetical protein
VESARVEECIAYYHRGGFRGLFGTPEYGFDQDNLDFLRRTTNAKWLWFWDVSLKNIDAIYELQELDYMGIHPKRPGIDFSRFPALQGVVNHWIKSDTGIERSTIRRYYLWHYKPRSKSFEGVEIPAQATLLHLTWANPTSLAGLPVMRQLKELQLHRCRNLTDLSLLPEIAPNLQRLLATTSSRIDTSAGVLDHPTLKSALIDGREMLAHAGD